MQPDYPPFLQRNSFLCPPTIILLLLAAAAYSGTYSPEHGSAPNTTEVSEEELSLLPAKGPYFVCDDRVIEDRWKIVRFVVHLNRHPDNPIILKEHPWEGRGPEAMTVLYDPKDERYKMWYLAFDGLAYKDRVPFSHKACYAESRDGLKWSRPFLGLFEYEDSKENNIIRIGWQKSDLGDVELNPKEHSAEERFIGFHNDCGGVYVSTSADGKTFNCSFEDSAVWYHSDTHNNAVYDEVRDRWLMFVRPRAYAGNGIEHVIRRRVAVKESKDLDFWTHERTVLTPREGDPDFFYSMPVFRLGDVFFGALQVYETVHHHLFIELAWSEDGVSWKRLPDSAERLLLNVAPEGAWDCGMVGVADKPIPVGDELWFYYSGTQAVHEGSPAPGVYATGLATTKRDRLIGARSIPGNDSRILTRPLPITDNLVINACATGEIRVEVRSAIWDEPIEGLTAEDCTPFTGDELEAPIHWGNTSLSDLKGEVVRLRFHLKDASLYAFDLKE